MRLYCMYIDTNYLYHESLHRLVYHYVDVYTYVPKLLCIERTRQSAIDIITEGECDSILQILNYRCMSVYIEEHDMH